ncbi:MAG TPA: GAF domain-containing sensor histidine kinase, partial [Thermoanaerobaculia bacterium]|nr:GAF domain-containing sensor histidine kinase [Thermoanaerobaculia bacterium]
PLPIADVIRAGSPVFIGSREALAARYPEVYRAAAGNHYGAVSAVMPLLVEGRAIGALAFSWDQPREIDEEAHLYRLLLAQHCAQALARAQLFETERRAREEAERLRERAAFLADASALLAASTEFGPTLESLARLAVPRFADWCTIDLAAEVATLPTMVAHADPAKVALAAEWSRRYPPRDEPSGPRHVLRTGRSQLYPLISDEMLVREARDADHLQILRDLHMRSVMIVPLNARGRTLGVITFIAAESGMHYGGEELAVAEDLADRAALAIDNARLLAEARQAAQARDDFLTTASHELRNPLNALQLVLLSLHRGALHRPEQCTPAWLDDKLGKAETQLDRLIELVEKLLDVSRLSGGGLPLAPEPLDLVELARQAVERHRHQAGGEQLRLGGDAEVRGEWDRVRLDQVIANLLTNAIKYGEGQPIDVEVRDRGDRALLVVQDRGIGIAPELQERIFERFARGTSERRFAGFGLGLWIARRAVDAFGGRISVESSPGAGARFEVELPKQSPASRQDAEGEGRGGG